MTLLPTIDRELRAQSRQRATHALRVLAAAALLAESFYIAVTAGYGPNEGGRVFSRLNGTLLLFIWVIVPLIAADSISRERREGTIGLLFLTPLKAREIVMAKGLVHGLRALTLWLAVLPVFTIPFLIGGVGWREAVLSAAINLSSLCCALAAALLASCLCKRWLRAQIMASVLAASFATLLVYASGFTLLVAISHFGPRRGFLPSITNDDILLHGFTFLSGYQSRWDVEFSWSELFSFAQKAGLGNAWLVGAAAMVACSALGLLAIIELAAWHLKRVWQEEPPSARAQRLWAKLSTPVIAVSFLHGRLRRKLELNPVGWLETRSWSGRTVMMGWFAAMVTFYVYGLTGNNPVSIFIRLQNLMALALLTGMAATAAGSFQRERETGVMELLLVSPMNEGQIIGGRVRAIWGQFLPAVVLLVVVWFYFKILAPNLEATDLMPLMLSSYLCFPVIGLYFSLQNKSFVGAFLLTLVRGLLIPYVLGGMLGLAGRYAEIHEDISDPLVGLFVHWLGAPSCIALIQLALAAGVARRLYRDLKHRNFAFSRTVA